MSTKAKAMQMEIRVAIIIIAWLNVLLRTHKPHLTHYVKILNINNDKPERKAPTPMDLPPWPLPRWYNGFV